MAVASNEHLYPFTLAFDEGLKSGAIDLATAGIFVDRVYEAWLEARVQNDPRVAKEAVFGAALEVMKGEGDEP